jgi:hypothetical protein
MVSDSRTLSHRVLASTSSPSRIVYSQTQQYTLRVTKTKKASYWYSWCDVIILTVTFQIIQSMVVIHLDNNNKITMLEDKWKGDDQPSGWASKVSCYKFLTRCTYSHYCCSFSVDLTLRQCLFLYMSRKDHQEV